MEKNFSISYYVKNKALELDNEKAFNLIIANLKKLDFKALQKIDEIKISYRFLGESKDIGKILKKAKNVKNICFYNGAPNLSSFNKNFKKVETIMIVTGDCPRVVDFSNLKSIKCLSFDKIEVTFLGQLEKIAKTIEELHIRNIKIPQDLTYTEFKKFLEKAEKLRNLSINESHYPISKLNVYKLKIMNLNLNKKENENEKKIKKANKKRFKELQKSHKEEMKKRNEEEKRRMKESEKTKKEERKERMEMKKKEIKIQKEEKEREAKDAKKRLKRYKVKRGKELKILAKEVSKIEKGREGTTFLSDL